MDPTTYEPTLARRVLRSERENGDLLTDLVKFTCQLAVSERRPISLDEARAMAAPHGLRFDAEGWVEA